MLLHRVVQCKRLQPLRQNRDLFPLNERRAGADALLGAAAGVQRDAGDAVVEHLFHEVGTGEAGIAVGEVETVSDGLATVFIVGDVETVVGEGFLHQLGFAAILDDVVAVAIGAVVDGLHHGSEGVLCRM